jgi:hypothetical protein
MNADDVQRDQHYLVRLGPGTEIGRVDAITSRRVFGRDYPRFEVYIRRLYCWRQLGADALLAECEAPEVYEAIAAKRHHDDHMQTLAYLAGQEAVRSRWEGCKSWPEHREAIISQQGTHFHAGDYGITRER